MGKEITHMVVVAITVFSVSLMSLVWFFSDVEDDEDSNS